MRRRAIWFLLNHEYNVSVEVDGSSLKPKAISTTGQSSKSESLHIHGYLSRVESPSRSAGTASRRSSTC
ncbi:hypothetical protein BDI4_190054 [Burkholderia diffusa]|nr:hypothetical protein BDI4_190054 [Burkholderia diffusa]